MFGGTERPVEKSSEKLSGVHDTPVRSIATVLGIINLVI